MTEILGSEIGSERSSLGQWFGEAPISLLRLGASFDCRGDYYEDT